MSATQPPKDVVRPVVVGAVVNPRDVTRTRCDVIPEKTESALEPLLQGTGVDVPSEPRAPVSLGRFVPCGVGIRGPLGSHPEDCCHGMRRVQG